MILFDDAARCKSGSLASPEAAQGGMGAQIMCWGRGNRALKSAEGWGDHGGRVPPLLFCSALFDTTNIWPRTAPQARYTRLARCPTALRPGPGGPGPRTARQFARYGPGWRGGSSAGQPSKAPRWTVAMGARAGSPRRTALISAFSRDGTGQPVVGASSSKQGSSDGARTPPQHRPAGAIFDHTRAGAEHSSQPSPTASEIDRTARHSLGHRTNLALHGEATAIGRCGSQVYRVSVSTR